MDGGLKFIPCPTKEYWYCLSSANITLTGGFVVSRYAMFEVNNLGEARERATAIGIAPVGDKFQYIDRPWFEVSSCWWTEPSDERIITLHLDDGRELYG